MNGMRPHPRFAAQVHDDPPVLRSHADPQEIRLDHFPGAGIDGDPDRGRVDGVAWRGSGFWLDGPFACRDGLYRAAPAQGQAADL